MEAKVVLNSLFVFILVGIGSLLLLLIPTIISKVRIAIAVRKLPKHHENHWLLGIIPYSVDYRDGDAAKGLLNVLVPMASKGHKIFGSRSAPGSYIIHLLHPDTIKCGTGSDPKLALAYRPLEPWLGNGLLTSNGAKWSRHRRLLTNAFHYNVLKSYVNIFSECTSVFIDKMGNVPAGESVDIVPHIRLLTLDVLLRCICGQETNCQKTGTHVPYVESVYGLSQLSFNRLISILARFDFIYALLPSKREYTKHCKLVHKFAMDVIVKRRQDIKSGLNSNSSSSGTNGGRFLDFIDILLAAKDENGIELSDQEIREEVDTFMFEGHDTTANSLCWMIYLLAKHPEHQAKCREEVDALFKDKDQLEWNDFKDLVYLHYCMKEANRLYPPVPSVSRELASPRTIDGYDFPAGTPVNIQIYTVHHNPHVWNNPEVFDPLRFTPENSKNRDPLAFIPFSAGPRNCIGQNFAVSEEKVILATLIHNYEFTLDQEHITTMKRFLLLHPDQVYIKLQRRV